MNALMQFLFFAAIAKNFSVYCILKISFSRVWVFCGFRPAVCSKILTVIHSKQGKLQWKHKSTGGYV